MAVPTFTSVTPISGPVGGRNLVTIIGTNFRLPPAPPTGGPVPVPPATVSAAFNGVATARVAVISATEIEVNVPPYRGASTADPFPAVAIVITNLDDNGDPIAGETVTQAAAYTYIRPPLRAPAKTEANQPYFRVTRDVLRYLKRNVVPAVALATSTDFGESGEGFIALSKAPGIVVVGPAIEEDFLRRFAGYRETSGSDEFEKFWTAYSAIFRYSIIGFSNSSIEAQVMAQSVIEMFMRHPWIEIDRSVTDPTQGQHRFVWFLTGPPNFEFPKRADNITAFACSIEIQDIPFELPEPIDRGVVVEQLEVSGATMTSDTETTIDVFGPPGPGEGGPIVDGVD